MCFRPEVAKRLSNLSSSNSKAVFGAVKGPAPQRDGYTEEDEERKGDMV